MKKTKTFIIEVTFDKLADRTQRTKFEKVIATSMKIKRALVNGVNHTIKSDSDLQDVEFLDYVKFRVVESE